MKTKTIFILFFCLSLRAIATEQIPDQLLYNNTKLYLNTGWGHPSPLQTYFYQNSIAYPFQMLSTANYRGHIATWVIQNDRFYLKEIEIDSKIHSPEKYNIKSIETSEVKPGLVFADWFSGVITCDKPRWEGSWEAESTFYFQIRNGKIVLMTEIATKDINEFYNYQKKRGEGLSDKYKLILLAENYVAYYYRLNENDEIEYKKQKCQLSTGVSRLSPIYGRYSNEHLNWPFNWENLEKNGAAHCKWKIINDSLILTGLELYSGLSFDSITKEDIDLNGLFPGEVKNQQIFAEWVTGIQLIIYGIDTVYDFGFKDFKPSEYTYCRFEKGVLKEAYSLPANFDGKNEENLDPRLKKFMNDY